MNFQALLVTIQEASKSQKVRRMAVQIGMVVTAAVVGGIIANKLDPVETVETIVETTIEVVK